MFNSLNTLSHLIENQPEAALEYNNHLADVYRYILTNKDKDLVLLREEVGFLKDYFFLLKLRFREAIHLEVEVPDNEQSEYLLPPIALQLLVENAVKHNDFSNASPLRITVQRSEDGLLVSNNWRPRPQVRKSLGIGLENLKERCELVMGIPPTFGPEGDAYRVYLPLLKS